MRFKVGDKVLIEESSRFFYQQKFDDNGKPIPLTITRKGNIYNCQYEVYGGRLYDDIDLDPYLENTEPQYEVY